MKIYYLVICLFVSMVASGQAPAITSWLQNSSETGSYYMEGNSVAMDNGVLYNCQKVEYSDNFVYVHTHGIPAYPTGPFTDGNPSLASDQNAIFQIPLFPVEKSGNKDETTGGNIGVFINGVALFDYRDGVGWDTENNRLCGGPGNPPCGGGGAPGMGGGSDWNRDAIPAEREGFDCSKAHPAMGNYHHHQNPSAFKLDLEVVSDICNLYDAEGLYAIDSTAHAPLIGYAYDGFPIYGAYGFRNADGTGGIERIKSSYQLRDITERTHYADGTDIDDGPPTADFILGYFREDYEYVAHAEEDYLDIHNGRFCVTPEYPDGTYAYFATVESNWVSAYPYVVGPTFYGDAERRSVNSVNESTTLYDATVAVIDQEKNLSVSIVPNPASDLIAVQVNDLVTEAITIELIDQLGKVVAQKEIAQGRTIAYFDVSTLYAGVYLVKISNGVYQKVEQVVINKF